MRKIVLALAAAGSLLLAGAGMAGTAAASVRPDNVVGTLYDTNGTAGYYTQSFGNTYTRVDSTFALTNQGTAASGGVGNGLCSSSTGHAAEAGAIPVGVDEWAVGYWRGYLAGDPTGDGDPCNGGSFLTGSGGVFTQLGEVPGGTSIRTRVQAEEGSTLCGFPGRCIRFTVSDSDLVSFSYAIPAFADPFNEGIYGLSQDSTPYNPPAANPFASFTSATATNSGGVTHGLAYWDAVEIDSSGTGMAPAVLSPNDSLSPAIAIRTWHAGHRNKKTGVWMKGYWTSSGLGASSFTVFGGSVPGL